MSQLSRSLRTVTRATFDRLLSQQDSAPKAIGSLLRSLLAREDIEPGPDVERLEQGWANWQAAFNGRVTLTKQVRPLRLLDGLAPGYLPPGTLVGLGGQVHGEVMRMAHSGIDRRSDFRLFFDSKRAEASDEAELRQISLIEAYTERAWERSVAANYACSYAYEPSPGDPDDDRLAKLMTGITSEDEYLPPGILRSIGLLPNARFQQFAGLTTRNDDRKVADLLISIPTIAASAATAWGIGQAADLGSAIGSPAGSVVGVLGTLGAVYATRHFRARPTRQASARLVEYAKATRREPFS